jgi:hypothetical protein
MNENRGLTRRTVVSGAVAVGVVGCGRTQFQPEFEFNDDTEPAARWPEDDMAQYDAPFTNPVILYGSTVVNPNSDGVIPNAALTNPLGLPMELLEVRFRLLPQSVSDNAPAVMGLGVGVKMDIGKIPVVDAYVPVGALGNAKDSYELNPDVYNDVEGNSLARSIPTVYGWRLKYPLFIPAGSTLACVVRALGQNQFPLSVGVAYIARTWDMRRPVPNSVKVPWVSSYESKGFDYVTTATASADESANLDVINNFGSSLEICRMAARVSFLQNEAGIGPGNAANSVYEDLVNGRDRLGRLTIRSSRGFDIIRTPISFGSLFPFNWRAWDLPGKWRMTPGEFYKFSLALAAVGETVPNERAGQLQFSVAATGYRDLPVSALVG